jgi:hypothetical protein
VAEYLTVAMIQALRRGANIEMLIGPPSSSEIFSGLGAFGSSILLKECFPSVDKHLSEKQKWRGWLWFAKPQNPDGTPIGGPPLDGPSLDGPSIDVRLMLAPVAVVLDKMYLQAASSAFEKRQTVVLKVSQKYRDRSSKLRLTDIELFREE